MMPPRRADPDVAVELLSTIRLVGGAITVLLVLLNALVISALIGASGMQATTTEMMALTRDMNASTTASMARLEALLSGVRTADVTGIVADARLVAADVSSIVGPVARHGNVSALVAGVAAVAGAVDAGAVARVVADAATVMHGVDGGVRALHPVAFARRVGELAELLDPGALRAVLADVRNVTAEARKIVDGLAASHNIQLKF